jgi:hypothetical protein
MTPLLLFIGFLGFVVLWRVRQSMRARIGGAILIMVALGVALVSPGLLVPSPAVPSGQVGWELGQDYGGLQFDPATADTTTLIPMVVDHPACDGNSPDWLGEPAIAYTPWSVTITMHSRYPFRDGSCGGGWYLSGMNALVALREPLGGRQLFDGSKSPPHPRSPGDPPSSFSR